MTAVVVGVERSAEGVAALELALSEALLRDLPLIAVRVWIDAVSAGFPLGAVVPTSAEDAERSARQLTEELVKEAGSTVPGADGVAVEVRALRGGAGAVLSQVAQDAELLVVGTRGAGPLSRVLLGSVTEHVLHHVRCPVAVVPAPTTPSGPPSRVLVGVDHSPPSSAALAWATDAAARRGAVLVPVSAHEQLWSDESAASRLSDLEAAEARSLRDAVPAREALRVEPEVVAGPAARALEALARPQDLLVVGSRGRGGAVGALLGSTSTHLVRHATCPVVVVRAG